MANKLRIGFDVDGILADFNVPYRELVRKFSGINLPEISNTYPTTWNYALDAGMLPSDDKKLWAHIIQSPNFWYNLDPYPGVTPFLQWLSNLPNTADIYFITSRPGLTAKRQTEDWLETFGFCDQSEEECSFATVMISGSKGVLAKALDLTHYIDDRNENSLDVQSWSPSTKNYMLARPWNRPWDGIPRIDNLDSFKSVLEADLG